MPINVYTGLMRSGKSYEVVSEVIIPAIAAGRRVVTNVDGISNDLVRAHIVEKQSIDIDKLGVIIHVTNQDVFKEDFFPYYDDIKGVHLDTLVQPGDLVCIDEAWRFWGDGKIHRNHKSFFLEHGHFTNEKTGVACDLVLMIQDMGTLNRFVKNVVAFNFRTHKKVSLGMGNTYSINCWEGHKQAKATLIGTWVRKYRKEIFPLYSSFKGGVQGKTVNIDSRQNIFGGKKIWLMLTICLFGGLYSFYTVWKFFHPVDLKPVNAQGAKNIATSPGALNAPNTSTTSNKPSAPVFSDTWRIAGSFKSNGESFVLLTNVAGAIRVESPSMFNGTGYAQSGEVDQAIATVWSGAIPQTRSASPTTQPPGVASPSQSATVPISN